MAQGKDSKKHPMIKGDAKVQKDETGYKIIGKTTRKVLNNQAKGTTDTSDDQDRDGGATRTSRGPR